MRALVLIATASSAFAQWSTETLPIGVPSFGLCATSAGAKLLFADGSSSVNVYDATSCTWSTASLISPRTGIGATGVGSLAFFAGGTGVSEPTSVVDIFDADTSNWTIQQLSLDRTRVAATAVGGMAIFAGGAVGADELCQDARVDIYDTASDTWSTAELSADRESAGATSVGSLAIIAGGYGSTDCTGFVLSRIDLYDSATNLWTTAELSLARSSPAATTVRSTALFAGGWSDLNAPSSRVDIYDAQTGTWSTAELSAPRVFIAATTVGDLAIFAGGWSGASPATASNVVDIYDASTGAWSATTLSVARGAPAAASIGNTALFIGAPPFSTDDTADQFRAPLGQIYCAAHPNSTGVGARVSAAGAVFAGCNDVTLHAQDLPPGQYGYFLTSQNQGMIPFPGGSQGTLCMVNPIGRFSSLVQNSGTNGEFSIDVDLTALPVTPAHAVQPGETWNFQCWFRDNNPGVTSNFTDAVSVTFD